MKAISTNFSSDRYGDCEVCGKRCSEVFKMKIKNPVNQEILVFGHKECLENLRKEK